MKRGLRALVVSLLVLVAPAAWAGAPEVHLEGDVGVERRALEAHLAVELEGASAPSRIDITRHGSALLVRLVYADGSDERRTVDVTDVTESEAPRVLALAIGEAARLRVPSARPEPAPAAPVVAPPAPPSPPSAPARRAPSPPGEGTSLGARLGAAVGVRVFGGVPSAGVEPRITFGLAYGRVGAELGASYFTAGASDPLGELRLHAVMGALAAHYELPLSERIALRAGPRLGLGAAFGSGTSTGAALASSTSGAMVTLVGHAALVVQPVAGAPWLELGLDAGGALRGLELRADDRAPLATTGATVGASLGLAWR